MEILQFLLSFLVNEFGGEYKELFENFQKNGFNLQELLKSIKPEMIAPLIKKLFSTEKNFNPSYKERVEGLSPIKSFADENIISTLNQYLENSF
jgi:hypothetical protein